MKVAFCLSGAPRWKHKGLFKTLECFKNFDQADFFVRMWKSDISGDTPEKFVQYMRDNGLDERFSFPVVQVLDDAPPNKPPYLPLNVAHWAPNFLQMWWGIYKADELRVQYQKETNEEYDLIFRVRSDMWPHDGEPSIDLLDYVERAKTTVFNSCSWADSIMFGGPAAYPYFIKFWDYLQHLSLTQEYIHPEEMLNHYMRTCPVEYDSFPISIFPYRDHDEYQVRPF